MINLLKSDKQKKLFAEFCFDIAKGLMIPLLLGTRLLPNYPIFLQLFLLFLLIVVICALIAFGLQLVNKKG